MIVEKALITPCIDRCNWYDAMCGFFTCFFCIYKNGGVLSNGRTAAFEAVGLGSSPSTPVSY